MSVRDGRSFPLFRILRTRGAYSPSTFGVVVVPMHSRMIYIIHFAMI